MSEATNGWDALIMISLVVGVLFALVVIVRGWPWKRGE